MGGERGGVGEVELVFFCYGEEEVEVFDLIEYFFFCLCGGFEWVVGNDVDFYWGQGDG